MVATSQKTGQMARLVGGRWWWLMVVCLAWALSGACGPEGTTEGEVTDAAQEQGPRELLVEAPTELSLPPDTSRTETPSPLPERERISEPLPEPTKETTTGCACSPWQTCEEGACVNNTCQSHSDCGAAAMCAKGVCRSRLECCLPGTKRCGENKASSCTDTPDGCGQWSAPQICTAASPCLQGECVPCRHRPCQTTKDCCGPTSCQFGYCLPTCDTAKGTLDNPACCDKEKDPDCKQNTDICYPLTSGGQPVCLPEGNQKEGENCSIVSQCGGALVCVDIQDGKGFRCFNECQPSKGTAGNPDCAPTGEECRPATGVSKGGLCIKSNRQPKKLHEACDANSPCLAPNLCLGEPGAGTSFCLAPCDPTATPSTCTNGFVCTGYDASAPQKGVCLETCSQPGTKDSCSYGLCRQKNNLNLCL